MTDTMLHTKAEVLRESTKVEEGVIDAVVGSTSIIDRMGDVIDQAGWNVKNFLKNPVILWGHNVHEERPPIGKALKVWKGGSSKKSLMFQVKFDLQDSFAAEIFRKVKDGFINTVSVGFLPTEWEELSPKDGPIGGRKYTKQELLELSFVPVPANPEAIVALRGMHDKRFEPVELKDLYKENEVDKEIDKVTEKVDEVVIEEAKEEKVKEDKNEPELKVDEKKDEVKDSFVVPVSDEDTPATTTPTDEKPTEEVPDEKVPVVETPAEEPKVDEKPVEEEKEKEEVPEAINSEKEVEVMKSVISFKDTGIAPDTEGWDGPGETSKAEVPDLKVMCTWFNSAEPDNKGSYKLPHHKAEDHKAVWRGVAAAMAALLGARGGVDIPEEDRKGVYNHLKKHYVQFDKPVPDYKMVEEQVLAKLGEEVQALTLDREDKHVVKLVKKVIKVQKEQKTETGYTLGQVKKALELLNIALSLYRKDSRDGGEIN
jgi:HK97 family phage prohead protease